MNARRAFLIGLLGLLVLAGCSRSTLYTVDVDVAALMSEEDRSGELPILDDVRLPDDEGLDASEFGIPEEAFGSLERLAANLDVELLLTEGADAAEATIALHVAPSGEPLFTDAAVVAALDADLVRDVPRVVSLEEVFAEGDDVMELLQTGDFRLGVSMSYEAATPFSIVEYEVRELDVSATITAGELLPF